MNRDVVHAVAIYVCGLSIVACCFAYALHRRDSYCHCPTNVVEEERGTFHKVIIHRENCPKVRDK